MSKKLPRARRKELREKGVLEAPSRAVEEARRERRAEEQANAPRERAVAEAVREEEEVVPTKPRKRRDLTPLVLAALVAIAGVIFWLAQRPQRKDTKADAPVPTATTRK